jgi:acyl-CoA synthetase (AMP-forming)/AMP-acid ligase II/uncharacterized protein YbaR (Trm112 family)
MLSSVIDTMACPACHGKFQYEVLAEGSGDGFLCCEPCETTTPVVQGFPLFPETQWGSAVGDAEWLAKEQARWSDQAGFADFLKAKSERHLYDGYAFFQPFNESSRVLLALVDLLRERLSPGDRILDTWCRTGWNGEWLASLFPEQEVVSIWEGNSNVLGYRGFSYWLPDAARRANLTFLFTHPDEPLPLADGAFDLVIGLDSLHRYVEKVFLPECRRVARDDAVLFFPHVHLSNSEPEPFFDRGCRQLHGRDWKASLDRLFEGHPNAPYVLAEPELFDCGEEIVLEDDSDTAHYNGAVLIGPRAWQGRRIQSRHRRTLEDDDRLVINPLIRLDLTRATVEIDTNADGPVAGILERHPIYQERLDRVLGGTLSGLECQILYLAEEASILGEIADAIDVPKPEVLEAANRLAGREIVFPASVSKAMARLQDYYGRLRIQQDVPTSFAELWAGLGDRYGDLPLILAEDGAEYDWAAVSSLVDATARWLEATTSPQDRVLIHTVNCPELLLVVWACWLTGRVAVPVDATLPEGVVGRIVERVAPAIVFSDLTLDRECLAFDSLHGDEDAKPLYSDRIEPHLEGELFADRSPAYEPKPGETALILFTSGSTGEPKAVRLDQRGLLHSAHELARHFQWKSDSRLLSLGPAHTMSGLRNPALAALAAGVTVVIPDPGLLHPARLLQMLSGHAVRYLATVPALLQQLCASKDRLQQEARPDRLELIFITGQAVADEVCDEIEAWLGARVRSYYGLTETGGICTADPLDGRLEGNLGIPAGAVAQAVDGERILRGDGGADETGELRIFSPANMLGYWEAATVSSVRQDAGWVGTGDVVRLLPDGSIDLVGRRDDQVKNRHGEVLYLQELERVATSLPEIADACCLEASQEGADAVGGSASVVLFAVVEDGHDPTGARNQLYEEVDRVLGFKKRPDEFRDVPAILRLANGKVDRKGML